MTGYHVYCGVASQVYTSMIAVGSLTNGTFPRLIPGGRYFFAATCVTREGLESPLSNEISYLVPLTDQAATFLPASPAALADVTLPGQDRASAFSLGARVRRTKAPADTVLSPGDVVVATATNTPGPVFLVVQKLGDGTFIIGGQGVPGATYRIEHTASPLPTAKWTTLGTVRADSSGAFLLKETPSPGLRLYRAVGP